VRILVVEDSVKMAALLRKGLEREGYAVDVAGSGQDAVWMADENEYDVIVLDIILESGESPLDGFAVCQKIRAAGCRTPVLMVTARDAVEDRVRGLDAGADDYMPKPFELAELEARVRALTRRGMAGGPTLLRHGTLTYDQVGRMARINGELGRFEMPPLTESDVLRLAREVLGSDEKMQDFQETKDCDAAIATSVDSGSTFFISGTGRVWFCGRKAHRVWTANGPLDTIPCEAVFNRHPAVFRSALVGVGADREHVAAVPTDDWKVRVSASARRRAKGRVRCGNKPER
jgi:DNA-binding response OmpR family regulator